MIPRLAQVEKSAKAAKRCCRSRPGGGLGQGFDGLDQGVAGVDIDTRLPVGQTVFAAARYGILPVYGL